MPGGEGARARLAVRSPVRGGDVAGEQVEAVVARAGAHDRAQRIAGAARRSEQPRTSAPRDGASGSKRAGSRTLVSSAQRPARVTPSQVPPRDEVAAGEPAFVPPLRARRGPGMVFVAVGGDHERRRGCAPSARTARHMASCRGARRISGRRLRGAAAVAASGAQRREALHVPPALAGDRRGAMACASSPAGARTPALGDRLVDLHPGRRVVASGQQAAGDSGLGFDGGLQRRDRARARPRRRGRRGSRRTRGPPARLAITTRRGRAAAPASRPEPRRAAAGGARRAPPGAPRRTSPLAAAASWITASSSLSPSGAGAALTTVPQAWSPNTGL